MNYPGHVIKRGSAENSIVTIIQQKLNEKGCGPISVNGSFDADTENALKLFQARFTDQRNNPLKVDGIIGPVTWATMFGSMTVLPVINAPNILLTTVLNVASSQIGIMEVPAGSNRGPEVDKYHDAAGSPHGAAWCMAFIFFCFKQTCINLGRQNPAIRTGGVLDHWNRATCKKILATDASVNTSLVLPGQIFIISTGGGHGHTGFIEKIEGGLLTTIEGNTNNNGSREGVGVFRRKARTINSINEGYLQYE
jgi:hypothetical protein